MAETPRSLLRSRFTRRPACEIADVENCRAVGEKTLRQQICRTAGRKILSAVDIVGGEGEVRLVGGVEGRA